MFINSKLLKNNKHFKLTSFFHHPKERNHHFFAFQLLKIMLNKLILVCLNILK
ncbi:Uncharacterized protein dnm_045200 [Desulfonema magnum]|uniref:Uncharacterized protein n=1 Tax=Desulfonema magnum TaxID=45655 RepID=A0A975BMK7_9BACT|nr:Uncharacterized protein dnm_045200 [Desulfonema magnum]